MSEKNEQSNTDYNDNLSHLKSISVQNDVEEEKDDDINVNLENKKNNFPSKINIKPIEIKIENMLKLINSSGHKKPKNNSNNMNKNILKIESVHLDIYEREKRNIIRKNNNIQKKKELIVQQQISKLQDPKLNENSKNIISKNMDYIPIQERAAHIYNMHQIHSLINKNKENIKKIEEEKEEILMLRKYENKKPFDKQDWNNFIENQVFWNKKKFLKKKAIELMRDNIEIKVRHKPKIDNNSKRIISNMRKKGDNYDDIFNKLYNDFTHMQERKKMKICNSMPSFKPLLNKGIKKSVFQNNKIIENSKNNYNNSIEKQIESIIQKKLKDLKKNHNNNSNKTFADKLNYINFNFNFDKNKIENVNKNNKRYGNINNKSYNKNNTNKSMNIKNKKRNLNLTKDSYIYKKFMNKSNEKNFWKL